MEHLNRQLKRTPSGEHALKSGQLSDDEKRFLSILRNPLSQKVLNDVLPGTSEVLITSLLRRGWIGWMDEPDDEELIQVAQGHGPAADQARNILQVSGVEQASPKPAPVIVPATAAVVVSAPQVPPPSQTEIEESVMAFLRMMDGK